MSRECGFCGIIFEPKKPKQVYCSSKCRTYAHRRSVAVGGFIYCLRNPADNEIFYIGRTTMSLNHRLNNHISDSKKDGTKKAEMIKNIISSGAKVMIELIEVVFDDDLLADREKYWIVEYRRHSTILNTNISKPKPIELRFNETILERIKSEHGVKTPQQALDWLLDNYDCKNTLNQKKTNIIAPASIIPAGLSLQEQIQWKIDNP